MDYQTELGIVKERIEKASDIVIVTHERPTFDSIGSSLALSLACASLGKRVTVACVDAMTVELSRFVGVDKIVTTLGKKNFVISLDYVDGSIEKVSYNIEGNKFNLVIEPRPGVSTFSEENVHFTHSGAQADLIIAVDTISLAGLGSLYEQEKEVFEKVPIIVLDRHPNNAKYGTVNCVDPSAAATAQLISECIQTLGVSFTEDIATNILNALYSATDAFQSSLVTARTFEVAATCRRSNGRKFETSQVQKEPHLPAARDISQQSPIASNDGNIGKQDQRPEQPKKDDQTPADWLKPKIFKSSHL